MKRIAWLQDEAEFFNFSNQQIEKWRKILSARTADDEEVDELLSERKHTPIFVASSVKEHLRGKLLQVTSLVPADIRYYDLLVGEPSAETNLQKFAATDAIDLINKLISRNTFGGLQRAFLLSSHSLFSNSVEMRKFPREEVLRFFQWLMSDGDRVSQLGGIECGLANIVDFPELEDVISQMIREFLNDEVDNHEGRLSLISGLIIMVDGQLARYGIAKDRPPFWRRLAAIAHASVIEREVLALGNTLTRFSAWARQNGLEFFYTQTLVDLRQDPPSRNVQKGPWPPRSLAEGLSSP